MAWRKFLQIRRTSWKLPGRWSGSNVRQYTEARHPNRASISSRRSTGVRRKQASRVRARIRFFSRRTLGRSPLDSAGRRPTALLHQGPCPLTDLGPFLSHAILPFAAAGHRTGDSSSASRQGLGQTHSTPAHTPGRFDKQAFSSPHFSVQSTIPGSMGSHILGLKFRVY